VATLSNILAYAKILHVVQSGLGHVDFQVKYFLKHYLQIYFLISLPKFLCQAPCKHCKGRAIYPSSALPVFHRYKVRCQFVYGHEPHHNVRRQTGWHTGNFHTEVTRTLGASVLNLVATVTKFPQVSHRWLHAQPILPVVHRGLCNRYHAQKYVYFLHSRTYIAQIKARFMREFKIPLFWDPTFRATETSEKNYHHTLRNIPEEHTSQARFKLAWKVEVCRLNKKIK